MIFSENKRVLKSVACFIADAYYHMWAIIRSSECVLYQRYMIDLVYRMMVLPAYQKFLKTFLNDIVCAYAYLEPAQRNYDWPNFQSPEHRFREWLVGVIVHQALQ